MNKSIIEKVTNEYIEKNLSNSKQVSYLNLDKSFKSFSCLYKDLPKTDIEGYPVASDIVDKDGNVIDVEKYEQLTEDEKKKYDLRYVYMPYMHEIYIGTTGSGKTTGCVEPQLRAITSQKNKPNLFITDPKGELFDHNAKHLIDNGYRYYVLNFKDPLRSDKWNPLLELYETKKLLSNLEDNRKIVTGPITPDLKINGSIDEYDEAYIVYDNQAFPNLTYYNSYIQFKKDSLNSFLDSTILQFAYMMIPEAQAANDRSWYDGARYLLQGLLYLLLEEAQRSDFKMTADMLHLRCVQTYYLTLRADIVDSSRCTLNNHPLTRNASNKIRNLMSTALSNAGNTMRSYCGVFEGVMNKWFQGHIFALTTGNTIDLEVDKDKPFAIFIITRDYEKSDFRVAGMFIDWVYRKMIERAEKAPKSINNKPSISPMHFILDEFGNIPEISDIENKIATARSRNIWFHLVLQSYAQLDLVYGEMQSIIIKDNCNSHIFLGAQNMKTKEIFSDSCGKTYVPTLDSVLKNDANSLINVPVLPISYLDLIKPGNIYNKRLFTPVMSSRYVRSYLCAKFGFYKDFKNDDGLINYTPILKDSISNSKYCYKIETSDSYDEDF